jgi:hypothetical protein
MSDIKVSVCVYVFDLMYLDGEVRASGGMPTMSFDGYLRFSAGLTCTALSREALSAEVSLSTFLTERQESRSS